MRDSFVRSRLALVVAAAVILAPGWYARGRPEPARGADLAARILAPTWDEGTVARAAPEVKPDPRRQYVKRFRSAANLASLAAFTLGTLGLGFLWLTASNRVRAIGRFRRSSRLSRAPPPLQLA
jgi:hypothetical protein